MSVIGEEVLKKYSPLPIVSLENIALPQDGVLLSACTFCNKKFNKGTTCREFYLGLKEKARTGFFSCPFGFAVYVFQIEGIFLAFSGLIVAPRLGNVSEQTQSKNHPEMKISQDEVRKASETLLYLDREIQRTVVGGLKVGLHEIRKYNRTIKQGAESLCRDESPQDPSHAKTELVRIWKTSELMSQQFEVVEFLGDESLFQLPRRSQSDLYRALDKCVRVHSFFAKEKDIKLVFHPISESPSAQVCDKTFPLILTVLIENAIKYAPRATQIMVRIEKKKDKIWEISVENLSKQIGGNLNDLMKKGTRGHNDVDGTGVGLYLAQMVARQHSSEIEISSKPAIQGYYSYKFSFLMNTH